MKRLPVIRMVICFFAGHAHLALPVAYRGTSGVIGLCVRCRRFARAG
jgi:hypothetical protein